MSFNNTYGPPDMENRLHDGAAATTATGVGQVGGSDKIIDLGGDVFREAANAGEGSYVKGEVVFNVTDLDDTTGDETYEMQIELSTDAAFGSDIARRASLKLGDGGSFADQNEATRYTLPFDNEIDGKTYRYMRLKMILAGTTPSITFTADPHPHRSGKS